jgi:branched-chain amino acid transport system ATP-binding protein
MAGMHPGEIDRLVEFLRKVAAEENVAIVAMVEHVMRAVVGMAEKVIVLHQGSKICDAATEEALNDPQVIECYLGHSPEGESA